MRNNLSASSIIAFATLLARLLPWERNTQIRAKSSSVTSFGQLISGNSEPLSFLSSISGNFPEVCFASLIIPLFVGEFDKSDWLVIFLGVVATFSFVTFSLWCAERSKL